MRDTRPFGGALRCILLCLALSAAADNAELPVGPGSADDPVLSKAEIEQRIRDLTIGKLLRSASGHFLIVGTNRIQNLALSGWAEDVSVRLGRALGAEVPFKNRSIDLVVRSGGEPPGGKVFVSEAIADGMLQQRMILWNYSDLEVEDARRELCRLLLAGYLDRTIAGKAAERTGDIGVRFAVPLWLAEGLSQYLDPNLRGPNTLEVIRRWETGRLPAIADFLKSDGRREPDAGMSAVLVNWLLVQQDKPDLMHRALERLDSDLPLDLQWLAGCVSGGISEGRLDESWDFWLHGRRRVVYTPGKATQESVRLLKAQLLLYPGNSGIPLTVDIGGVLGLGDLIERRGEEWVPAFCRRKIRAISLLAVGRGEELGAVAAMFCNFLDALHDGDSETKLKACLKKAEKALTELEAQRPVAG